MTSSLQEAFDKASGLPEDRQNALAAILLEEMASEERWSQSFAKSEHALSKLADEALEEHDRGRTVGLDESL